jgi:hypothetical protein
MFWQFNPSAMFIQSDTLDELHGINVTRRNKDTTQ